jgi:hypothetical protein
LPRFCKTLYGGTGAPRKPKSEKALKYSGPAQAACGQLQPSNIDAIIFK